MPRLLARGGPDLLVVDERGELWRWRPSDGQGGGTLGQVRVAGDQVWDASVVDVETFVINPDQGLYRLYVPYPASSQILRYDPTADGSGFSVPVPYFVGEGEDVAAFRQLLIDGDVYAVTSPQPDPLLQRQRDQLRARGSARQRRPAPGPRLRAARRQPGRAASASSSSGTSCTAACSCSTRTRARSSSSSSPRRAHRH